jgi:hypothetical protein
VRPKQSDSTLNVAGPPQKPVSCEAVNRPSCFLIMKRGGPANAAIVKIGAHGYIDGIQSEA